MGTEQKPNADHGEGASSVNLPSVRFEPTADIRLLPASAGPNGKATTPTEDYGFMDMEKNRLLDLLSERQRSRIAAFNHAVDTMRIRQSNLDRGIREHFVVRGEDGKPVLDKNGKEKIVVVTQETINSMRRMIGTMLIDFSGNPVMMRLAHRKISAIKAHDDARDGKAREQLERMWETGSDEDI